MRLLATAGAGLAALVLVPVLLIALLLGGVTNFSTQDSTTVDPTKIPPLAASLLPELERLTATSCPELPALWLVALAQVESSWDPTAFNAVGRAAGLFQMTESSWIAAGGAPWPTTPPPADADVLQPTTHLQLAVPWICSNFHSVTAHLGATGKPTSRLDALLVCHIAGCGRVLNSRTGVPANGEAGCDVDCTTAIRSYIATVHETIQRFTTPAGPASIAGLPRPAPFTGPAGGCVAADPTRRDGCLTPVTRHALDQLLAAFGQPGPSGPIQSIGCWDEHAWNPNSDHPHGRACDIFPGQPGQYATGDALAHGWQLASWLRTYADELKVSYLIWQGRFWSPRTRDEGGWGRPYTGGGIYDVRDVTGGHWDHLHTSFSAAKP